jgi:hypothetical protein
MQLHEDGCAHLQTEKEPPERKGDIEAVSGRQLTFMCSGEHISRTTFKQKSGFEDERTQAEPPTPMQDLIDCFVTWAQLRPDVRAGVVLGSWARNDMPADNLSDLDLVVINLHFYEKFGREVANGFGYDFPEEAYAFAVGQLKQLTR